MTSASDESGEGRSSAMAMVTGESDPTMRAKTVNAARMAKAVWMKESRLPRRTASIPLITLFTVRVIRMIKRSG